MIEETFFKPVKIASATKFSKMLIDPKITVATMEEDFIMGTLTARLDAFIAGHTSDQILIKKIIPKPTFFDWLLRRERSYEWTIDVNDFLLNPPPKVAETIRMFELKEVDKDDERTCNSNNRIQ